MKVPSLIVKSLGILKGTPSLTRVGEAISDHLIGTNNISAQLATNPNGPDVIPAPVAQVQAQHLGNGLVDVAITDNSDIARAINYHIEYDTSPNFTSNPRGTLLGPYRNGQFTLPNGTWYVRGFSQYPAGGPPSAPIAFPQPVVVTGSAALPLLNSQGSGTGRPGQAGQGAGKTVSR
jgi:hypothetical protein